jgi:hypothetical protein
MSSLFFDIALPRLSRLATFGAIVDTELSCKCDVVKLRKGAKRIEVAYEPYGPPFCDVKYADGPARRIEVVVPFLSGLGSGDKTSAALTAHEDDLRAYVDALYPKLEAELQEPNQPAPAQRP